MILLFQKPFLLHFTTTLEIALDTSVIPDSIQTKIPIYEPTDKQLQTSSIPVPEENSLIYC